MGGFRKYCVMHSYPSDPRAQKRPLVTAPFQMLEKATGKDGVLERHQKMQCHQLALEAGIAIIRSVQKPKETLPYRISTQNQEMFEKDMNALRAIISTIILCGKQNIPLRGPRDDSIGTASNKGNFHAILMLLGNSDKNLQEHLLTGRRNATSTSKTVQEEVIRITGGYILAKVTQPIQREEILSVCLRFLDLNNDGSLKFKEVFFDYVNLDRTTGESIANAILSSLAENNIKRTGLWWCQCHFLRSKWCARKNKKNGIDGTVHLLKQSRFESQCCSRMQVNFSQKHDWNLN